MVEEIMALCEAVYLVDADREYRPEMCANLWCLLRRHKLLKSNLHDVNYSGANRSSTSPYSKYTIYVTQYCLN